MRGWIYCWLYNLLCIDEYLEPWYMHTHTYTHAHVLLHAHAQVQCAKWTPQIYIYIYIYIMRFKVTRRRHISRGTRLAADLHSRGNESTITLQQGWQSVFSLRSTWGYFRSDPGAHRRTIRRNSREKWEAVQESRGSSKAGRVPAQGRLFELEFRSLASLAVWLDQEEDLVQLVPEKLSGEMPVPIKSCWRNCSMLIVTKVNKSRFQSESTCYPSVRDNMYVCVCARACSLE
jgi:hypothetical protein